MKAIINIFNFFRRIFTPKIDYDKLYSSPWNREKSIYLRGKIKGKKSIAWYEKKGKRGYFDKSLKGSVDYPMHGFDDEMTDDTPHRKINPEK